MMLRTHCMRWRERACSSSSQRKRGRSVGRWISREIQSLLRRPALEQRDGDPNRQQPETCKDQESDGNSLQQTTPLFGRAVARSEPVRPEKVLQGHVGSEGIWLADAIRGVERKQVLLQTSMLRSANVPVLCFSANATWRILRRTVRCVSPGFAKSAVEGTQRAETQIERDGRDGLPGLRGIPERDLRRVDSVVVYKSREVPVAELLVDEGAKPVFRYGSGIG